MINVTREQAREMAEAHAEGLHELAREGCPECEGRELREYPLGYQPQPETELGCWSYAYEEE